MQPPRDFFLWGYVKDKVYVHPLPASIPELKVVTCYKQFGTNSIIVLMFVELMSKYYTKLTPKI